MVTLNLLDKQENLLNFKLKYDRIRKYMLYYKRIEVIDMPNNIQKILNDFLEEVKIILGSRLKKIVLYGSYARGDYNKSSDIDIMILTDLSDKEISEYSMKIWEKSADIEIDEGIVLSPIVRNIDNFEAWSDVQPFYMSIINEGVVLVGEKN